MMVLSTFGRTAPNATPEATTSDAQWIKHQLSRIEPGSPTISAVARPNRTELRAENRQLRAAFVRTRPPPSEPLCKPGMEWTTVLASSKSVMARGPRSRPMPLYLKPPYAKPSFVSAHPLVHDRPPGYPGRLGLQLHQGRSRDPHPSVGRRVRTGWRAGQCHFSRRHPATGQPHGGSARNHDARHSGRPQRHPRRHRPRCRIPGQRRSLVPPRHYGRRRRRPHHHRRHNQNVASEECRGE
jgi:hypothetical protein